MSESNEQQAEHSRSKTQPQTDQAKSLLVQIKELRNWINSLPARIKGWFKGEDKEDWGFIEAALNIRFQKLIEYYKKIDSEHIIPPDTDDNIKASTKKAQDNKSKLTAKEKTLTLATTDFFVEKAQKHLCSSARRFLVWGIICGFLTVAVTVTIAIFLFYS